tara:strand:- start:16469 stop:17254 length:786 start_codon:yes stop_codon:yes gene_type:complete
MKKTMIKLALGAMLTIGAASVYAQAGSVIDLSQGFNGQSSRSYIKKISEGQRIVVSMPNGRPQYVERIHISAEGAQRAYSFAKVYADGEEIATLGVPGKDPDYPIIVRGEVSEITVVAQANSKVRVLDFRLYTAKKVYSSYASTPMSSRRNFTLDDWGGKVLDLTYEFMQLSRVDSKVGMNVFSDYIKPLKRAAISVQASENARDGKSLNTKDKAKLLVEAIDNASPYFNSDEIMMNFAYDRLVLDLETIKEDILEKYDLN